MRQAPGELGKIQWDAAAGRSAIDNLPSDAALIRARAVLTSILERVERLNDRYYPVKGSDVESVGRDECDVVDLNPGQRRDIHFGDIPPADCIAFDGDNHTVQDATAAGADERIGLNQDPNPVANGENVHSLFDRRLDRIFRGR